MTDRASFLQLHFLTSFPPSLLNRDDAGLAKRIPFGGVSRIRISSQCLKHRWRTVNDEHSLKNLGVDMAVRSRAIFEREIAGPLIQEGHNAEKVAAVLRVLMTGLLSEEHTRRGAEAVMERSERESPPLETRQPLVLGRAEINYLKALAADVLENAGSPREASRLAAVRFRDRKFRDNFKSMKAAAGLDAALFGRMSTSDVLARCEAAVHVAHAFTVHAEETESDYFTVVDELVEAAGLRSSTFLGETELNCGFFYGYLVLDIPGLLCNLEGTSRGAWKKANPALAARVGEALVHLAATVSPEARRGSTAAYSYAHLLLLEAGHRQPRSLANAFLAPVDNRPGQVAGGAVNALAGHLKQLDRVYGQHEQRRFIALEDCPGLPAERVETLAGLAAWAAAIINGTPAKT